MSGDGNGNGRNGVLLRYLGAGVAASTIAVVSWAGVSVLYLRERVAVIDYEIPLRAARISKLEAQVEVLQGALNASTDSRYRATDATRDLSSVGRRIDDLGLRVHDLEKPHK